MKDPTDKLYDARTPSGQKFQKRVLGWTAALVGVILAAPLVLGGMAYCLDQPAARDASAVIACRDFLRLRADISKGIVSDAEMRPRVVAIYDSVTGDDVGHRVCGHGP